MHPASSTRSAVRRLALSRLLSTAGTDASAVALGWAMFAQTGSTAWLSASLLITIGGGSLLAPLAGWVGDRVDRRRLMLGDLWAHPVLRLLAASACISTFVTSVSMTAEVPLAVSLGAGPVGLGALTAAWGLGMTLGSCHAGRSLHAGNEATGVLAGRATMAVGIGLVATLPILPAAVACYALGGVGGGFMAVAAQSLIVRRTPDPMRARLLAAIDGCRNLAFGAGVLAAGAVVELLGPRPAYALVGIGVLIGCAPIAALVRQLGGLRPLRAATA